MRTAYFCLMDTARIEQFLMEKLFGRRLLIMKMFLADVLCLFQKENHENRCFCLVEAFTVIENPVCLDFLFFIPLYCAFLSLHHDR